VVRLVVSLLALSASPLDELRYTPEEMQRYQDLREELVPGFACVFELADWNQRGPVRYVAFGIQRREAKGAPRAPALAVSLSWDGKHQLPSPGPDAERLKERCGFAVKAKRTEWPLDLFGGGTVDDAIQQTVVCSGLTPVSLKVSHKASGKEVSCPLPAVFR
jgi:hypothetical protein